MSGDYLRGNKLSHRVWDIYAAIVQACAEAWHFLIGDPECISQSLRVAEVCVNA